MMTTKLTKRDKVLLYMMAIVLIVFGFVMLVLLPQMERGTELDAEIATLETQKLPIETAVMGLPAMQKAVETAKENLSAALSDFYPHMENYEIDRTLTSLLIGSYGLRVDSFNIDTAPRAEMVPLYGGGNIPLDDGAETAAAGETDAAGTGEGEVELAEITAEGIPLMTSRVTISTTGTRESFQRLVDDMFKGYPSIRVTGYSIGGEDQADSLGMTIYMDVYMQRP